jgi:tRNA (cytidine/uridine-2'-O-)-methyltransferase
MSCGRGFLWYNKEKQRNEVVAVPTLNIVLVEPEIPQNTGNISRTCAATGARLHIVEPMGFKIDDKKLKRAGLDYWHLLDITYYKDLDDFFARNEGPFFYFSTKAKHIHSDVEYPDGAYLVFGKETKGLPEGLLHDNPESCVRLPMIDNDSARSLNLSNAVAVGAFEVLRQWGYPGMRTQGHLTQYDD